MLYKHDAQYINLHLDTQRMVFVYAFLFTIRIHRCLYVDSDTQKPAKPNQT